MKFEYAENYRLTTRSQIIGAVNDYAQMYLKIKDWKIKDNDESFIYNIDLATDKLVDKYGESDEYAGNERELFEKVGTAYNDFVEALEYVLGVNHEFGNHDGGNE